MIPILQPTRKKRAYRRRRIGKKEHARITHPHVCWHCGDVRLRMDADCCADGAPVIRTNDLCLDCMERTK